MSDDLVCVQKGDVRNLRVTAAPVVMLQEMKPEIAQRLQQGDKTEVKQASITIVLEKRVFNISYLATKSCDMDLKYT